MTGVAVRSSAWLGVAGVVIVLIGLEFSERASGVVWRGSRINSSWCRGWLRYLLFQARYLCVLFGIRCSQAHNILVLYRIQYGKALNHLIILGYCLSQLRCRCLIALCYLRFVVTMALLRSKHGLELRWLRLRWWRRAQFDSVATNGLHALPEHEQCSHANNPASNRNS